MPPHIPQFRFRGRFAPHSIVSNQLNPFPPRPRCPPSCPATICFIISMCFYPACVRRMRALPPHSFHLGEVPRTSPAVRTRNDVLHSGFLRPVAFLPSVAEGCPCPHVTHPIHPQKLMYKARLKRPRPPHPDCFRTRPFLFFFSSWGFKVPTSSPPRTREETLNIPRHI